MTSSITGIQLALPDEIGVYKKTKRLYMGTAGVDASTGGYFLILSGAGVIKKSGTAGTDIYGIGMDGVPAAADADGSNDLYIDVYNGLEDKFTAIIRAAHISGASSLLNGATVYASGGDIAIGVACALDIVGTVENGSESVTEGARVIFSLTPSEAIAGYDSGNVA